HTVDAWLVVLVVRAAVDAAIEIAEQALGYGSAPAEGRSELGCAVERGYIRESAARIEGGSVLRLAVPADGVEVLERKPHGIEHCVTPRARGVASLELEPLAGRQGRIGRDAGAQVVRWRHRLLTQERLQHERAAARRRR